MPKVPEKYLKELRTQSLKLGLNQPTFENLINVTNPTGAQMYTIVSTAMSRHLGEPGKRFVLLSKAEYD